MILSRELCLSAVLAPLALGNPGQVRPFRHFGRDVGIVDGLRDAPVGRRAEVFSSGPKPAVMVRRNGLVARTDTKDISLDQSLENELLFDR